MRDREIERERDRETQREEEREREIERERQRKNVKWPEKERALLQGRERFSAKQIADMGRPLYARAVTCWSGPWTLIERERASKREREREREGHCESIREREALHPKPSNRLAGLCYRLISPMRGVIGPQLIKPITIKLMPQSYRLSSVGGRGGGLGFGLAGLMDGLEESTYCFN